MNEIPLFITGIVLFLIGMMKLSGEIRKLFTSRLRSAIRYAVRKPLYGLLSGIVATILLQSSSATTLLTIGMVSAGLISFYHSLGIILGADIGTTLTVQLVVWRVTDISPIFMIAGGTLWLLGNERLKPWGEVVFSFGLMFFGLSLISQVTAPLRHNPAFLRFFQEARSPLTGIVIGALFTGVVHASAIPIGILVILGQQHLITLETALPIVFGANIGTTVTALMASAVANANGRRTAVSHFLFKCLGTILCLAALPVLTPLLKAISGSAAQQIALSHFFFNLIICMALFFFLRPFARLMEKAMPGSEDALPLWPEFLEEQYLTDPEVALHRVHKELQRQIVLVRKMLRKSSALVDEYREGERRNLFYIELVVDNLRLEIIRYLRRISCNDLSEDLSQKLFAFTAMVDDIERIGDHTAYIALLARDKRLRRISFSEEGKRELAGINGLVAENLDHTVSLLEVRDEEKIREITRREEEIDAQVKAARERHLVRYHKRICQAEAGPIFIEILIHLERISDHCENIAEHIHDLKDGREIPPLNPASASGKNTSSCPA